MGSQDSSRRIVEDHGRRQRDTGRLAQPGTQFDGRQRVEPEILERPGRGERVAGDVAQHGGRLVADHLRQLAYLLGLVQARQSLRERRRAPWCRGSVKGSADLGQVTQQRAGTLRREGTREPFPVDVGHDRAGHAVADRAGDDTDRGAGRQREEPAAGQMAFRLGVDHAAACPRTPCDGRGGQARRPAVLGERVQVGVRRTVRGLATAAPDARDRGEQHERVQRGVAQQLVKVPGAGDLRRQRTGEFVGTEAGERGRALDARRVDNGVERRKAAQQFRDGGPVRDVAGGERDPGTQAGKLGLQQWGAFGRTTTTTDQHHVLSTLRRDPARHLPAQRTETSGHQHRPPRRPARSGCPLTRGPLQPPAEDPAAANRDLILARRPGEHRREQITGRVIADRGEIDQTTPASGMFQRGDPAQAPEGRLFEPVDLVTGVGGHRARGQAPQGYLERPDELHQGVQLPAA
ncbi:hypothetical protein GCM10010434_086800 [Winogradskya humida]